MQQQSMLRGGRAGVRPVANAVAQTAATVADEWTEAVTLRKLSAAMNGSPDIAAQRRLSEALDGSAFVAAQRTRNDALNHLAPIAQRVSIRDAYQKDLAELSRPELNVAIDNREIDERERIAAEVRLKDVDQGAVADIRRLAQSGDFTDALTAAASLAGVAGVTVRPTDDYAAVIPRGEDVPRGIPHGVTVPGVDGAVVYIHEYWIKKWADDDTIGNLLSTITHEAKHADQFGTGSPAPGRGDAKEFEAYAREIVTANVDARNFENVLLPDAHHIETAYKAALDHYGGMNGDEQAQYAVQKAEIERIMPRLRSYLEGNDETSGRTGARIAQIRGLAGQALDADTTAGFDPLYNEANRLFQTLPESQRAQFDGLFDQLQEHSRDLWRARK